jgi:hypothetical protein
MQAHGLRLWQTPQRLSTGQAKLIGGLGIAMVALGASGLFLYDGWARVVHVSALALLGLANLVLAAGSLLPEEQGNTLLRQALPPLVVLMFIALFASVATHWVDDDGIDVRYLFIGAVAGGIVPWVLRRTRTG